MGIVYHYTGTQAFEGVIEKAALWATALDTSTIPASWFTTWAALVERLEQLVAQPGITPRRIGRSLNR